MSALSSLFKHLVRHGHMTKNLVTEIARSATNREEGTTLAFAKQDARKQLDLPDAETLEGLRDRAILSVGLRRAMSPDAIDRVVRKYAAMLGLTRGYSAHSMRATFITTTLYDRRGYNPEKAASFFATY